MDKFNHPEPLCFEGNIDENWRRWKQCFEICMTATGTDARCDKVNLLLYFIVRVEPK